MTGLSSASTAYGALVLAAVLWGGSIVAQKLALGSFSAVEASVLRDIGGLAILLTTWWWQGELWPRCRVEISARCVYLDLEYWAIIC